MIVLVGASASGKSSIEKRLVKRGVPKITSYTTRPLRDGEMNGVDYHFISEREFSEKIADGFFAENTIYRGWYYGTAKEDCTDDKILIVDPHGLRQLRKSPDIDITAFYIKASDRTRLIRMLKRGDEIMECIRRYFSDMGTFQNIEEDVDVILDGEKSLNYLTDSIIRRMMDNSK